MTTTDSTNTIIAMVKNEPSQYDWGFRDGFAAGLKQGARRERRALRESFKRQRPSHRDCILGDWVRHWLASRKRKGGK